MKTFNREHYPDEMEELYLDALDIAKTHGYCGTPILQRKLRIGYFKARELIDMLFERGIIEPENGAKPRKVINTSIPT
jgi:DNA segregation ATPase FtsK/SpoIIIE, S-DNA-T family